MASCALHQRVAARLGEVPLVRSSRLQVTRCRLARGCSACWALVAHGAGLAPAQYPPSPAATALHPRAQHLQPKPFATFDMALHNMAYNSIKIRPMCFPAGQTDTPILLRPFDKSCPLPRPLTSFQTQVLGHVLPCVVRRQHRIPARADDKSPPRMEAHKQNLAVRGIKAHETTSRRGTRTREVLATA
jgi:hypothetical protein